MEATCIFGSDINAGATARRQQVYDAINRIESPNFFLAIDVKEIGAQALPTTRLRRELEGWLSALDPDAVELALGDNPRGERFDWKERGWKLAFRPIPVRADSRGQANHRVLGVFGPGEAQWLDDVSVLRGTIRSKGSAYGALDLPLVVAVNVATAFHDEEDTLGALFGTWKIQFEVGDPDSARSVRARDGYWGSPGEWKHRHLAGLLLAHNVAPWRVTQEIPTLWLHPDPIDPVKALGVWRTSRLDGTHIERLEPYAELGDHFGLPEQWPDGEPFPRNE
ncbi:hypothetical protein ASE14_15200 [Agromyces sp. Root81]|nr:hypothetical protein ASE14_15200 [Agromyces sp. Root81]